MYIEPNTNIFILNNVPLDNTYKNTIFFDSENGHSKQYNYFVSKRKHTLIEHTYQRVNKGVMRVGIKAELLYDCNYLMFQNESFGNKWFYAFINKVEYINNVVSEIYFEIDVMQTWYFDYTLKPSFVEREHSETDNIGDNIVPESLELGEYMFDGYQPIIDNLHDACVVIATSDVDTSIFESNASKGYIIDKTFQGTRLWFYDLESVSRIEEKVSEYLQAPEKIVNMYMIPKALVPPKCIDNGDYIEEPIATQSVPLGHNYAKPNGTEKFGNYPPKNMKMYTFPYNYFHVDNGNGSSLALRYEFFSGDVVPITIDGTLTQPVKMTLRPANYKGLTGINCEKVSHTESITIDDFPMCSWNHDTFKQWLVQNAVPMAINVGVGLATAGLSMATTQLGVSSYMAKQAYKSGITKSSDIGKYTPTIADNANIANAIGSSKNSILQSEVTEVGGALCSAYQASIANDVCKGSTSGNVNWAKGYHQFYSARCHITEQYAKCIDEYFTMYGYQTNRVKVPNTNAREHWTYVKTIGCNAIAKSMPTDDLNFICRIFDKGVTFWKNPDKVGDYSLDNSAWDDTPNLH